MSSNRFSLFAISRSLSEEDVKVEGEAEMKEEEEFFSLFLYD